MNHLYKRGRHYRLLISILIICITYIALYPPHVTAAATNTTITSLDDFYAKLSEQIYVHEVRRTYTVTSAALQASIFNMSFQDYEDHYNASSPLTSGCYLSYYIQSIHMQYRGNDLTIILQYHYFKEDMDRHFAMMYELAQELKGNTDYDTVQNVHDYLIENFEYDRSEANVNHTDIDGFKDKQMVCSGYSLATYYLLNELGIPTRIITGYGGTGQPNTSNHAWNMVELDGKWYNLDVTWDDGGGRNTAYTYFLKSDADFPQHTRLGEYDTEYYTSLVSERSYSLPLRMRIHYEYLRKNLVIYIIIGIVITIWIRNRWRYRQEAIRTKTTIIYDTFGQNDETDINSP